MEKLAENLGYFCNFPKAAQIKQCPLGENSPNLVALALTTFRVTLTLYRVAWSL
jgi:hypothetical protein